MYTWCKTQVCQASRHFCNIQVSRAVTSRSFQLEFSLRHRNVSLSAGSQLHSCIHFQHFVFLSLCENFPFYWQCYCELNRHQCVMSGVRFGIVAPRYSAVSRKLLDKIPKRGLTGAKSLWEGIRESEKYMYLFVALNNRCTLLLPARPRVPRWIPTPQASLLCKNTLKRTLLENCFHTEAQLLISSYSTF